MTNADAMRERWTDPEYRAAMLAACARGRRTQARLRAQRQLAARLAERAMPHAARTSGGERLLRAVVRTGIEPSALPVAAALVAALDEAALERREMDPAASV